MKVKRKDWKKICPICKTSPCRKIKGEWMICEMCADKRLSSSPSDFNGEYKEVVPPRFRKAVLSDLEFKMNPTQSYLLTGEVGRGKTHAMAACALALARKGEHVAFITSTEMLDKIRKSYKNADNYISVMLNVKFLFLDDIGVEKSSDWVLETLYKVINHRYNHMKHVTASTNLSLDNMAGKGDPRIVSRIVEMCKVLKVTGEDRRIN